MTLFYVFLCVPNIILVYLHREDLEGVHGEDGGGVDAAAAQDSSHQGLELDTFNKIVVLSSLKGSNKVNCSIAFTERATLNCSADALEHKY